MMTNIPRLGLHHIRLPVTDPWTSRDWYSRVFGCIPVLDLEEENGVVGVVLRHDSGFTLGLHLDPARARALRGFAVLGLSVRDSDELAEWTQRLDDLVVIHGALEEGHLGSYMDVPDPDGIVVRLHTGLGPDAEEA
jgi:catechol 2,3-dioxygenase-like lactoylglutathione lyase family enzyme